MALATRIRGLSPFGPIFTKELRVSSRRKRNHLLRVLYLGALLLLLVMMYMATAYSRSYDVSVAQRVQAQAMLGQAFFAAFSIFSVVAMGVIAPILTSTAINAERLGRTLPVLLMTPITSWQIVAGKLFSRLLLALMLLGLSLPMLAIVRLLGSVEIDQMVAVVSLCVVFALFTGAIGLFFSAIFNRTYVVILVSYATLFVLYFLLPCFFVVLISSVARSAYGRVIPILLTLNPVLNVSYLSSPSSARMGFAGSVWIWDVMVHLVGTAALLTIAAILVRRHDREPAATSAATKSTTPVAESTDRPAAAPAAAGASRSVGENPVLWRELRPAVTSRRWVRLSMRLIVYALLISYVIFGLADGLDERGLQIMYGMVFHVLFWMGLAVLAGTCIAQEKESDTWTLLLVTPLSGGQIVMGKLLGVFRRMLVPFGIIVTHFAVFAACNIISVKAALLVLWVIFTFNSIWAASGLYLSLSMRRVTPAVIVNLCIPIVIYAVVPIVLLILGELIARDDDWPEVVLYYLPYAYIAGLLENVPLRYGRDWIYFAGQQISVAQFVFTALFVGVAHLLIAALIVVRAMNRFDNLVGRAYTPQRDRATPDNSQLGQNLPPLR